MTVIYAGHHASQIKYYICTIFHFGLGSPTGLRHETDQIQLLLLMS